MTVGLKIDGITGEIGSGSFLHAFFSTISAHLEPDGWGTRFPVLMNDLYQGHIDASQVQKVLDDLKTIHKELEAYGPEKVVWDIEDRSAEPPWGDNIAPEITSLANYFVTSTGRDLFWLLEELLAEAVRLGSDASLTSY